MVGSLPLLPFSKCLCAAFGEDLVWGQEGRARRGQKELLHFLLVCSSIPKRRRRFTALSRFAADVFCPAASTFPAAFCSFCFFIHLCTWPRWMPCTWCMHTCLKSGSDVGLPQSKKKQIFHPRQLTVTTANRAAPAGSTVRIPESVRMFSINAEEREGKQTRDAQTQAAMLIPPQTRAKVQKQKIGEATAANHRSSAHPPPYNSHL